MRVKPSQPSGNFLIICPDERKGGMLEILDGGAFPQKLWIERYAKFAAHAFP